MPLLHDQSVRSRIEGRLRALTPDRRPLWGKMSIDQMLWHLNEALAGALARSGEAPHHREAATDRCATVMEDRVSVSVAPGSPSRR